MLEKFPKVFASNFFFTFNDKIDIDRQIAALLERLLNTENVRKDLAFVVGRSASENVSIFQDRLERRGIPQLKRIGRLHVVMPVNQNGSGVLLECLLRRPNNRMTGGGDHFRFEPDAGEFLRKPLRALANFGSELIVG